MRLAHWVRLARLVGQRGDFAQRGVIAIVALGERLLGPVLVDVAATAGAGKALAIGALLSSIYAIRGLLQSVQIARTEAGVYMRVVDSVLRQDVLQPSVLPDEEARAALFEGAHSIASLMAESAPNLCANIVAALIFGAFVAIAEPARIVTIAALAGVSGIVLLAVSRRAMESAQQAESSAWIDLADGVSDAFDGRLEIVAAGRTDTYARKFANVVSEWSAARTRAARVSRLAGRLPLLALAVSVAAAVVLDSVLRGQPASRTLSQAVLLASMSPAFVGIVQGIQEMVRSGRRAQHMLALMAVEAPPGPKQRQPLGDVRSVELRDVHFAYERAGRRHEALRGVSLTWCAGELLTLAGPNGSGKSTCLRLLLGLGKPRAGDVLVGGAQLECIDMEQWRRGIAFLPQRPYLPPRSTVRDCLRFIDSNVADEVMTKALERVGMSLRPQSGTSLTLDARVDELSVGQRQRIGLARVLCREAFFVMLDEPDANLDHDGVQLVAGLVRELARDHMVVVAAHSPDLLAAADRVVALDAGRIRDEHDDRVALA
jgi:ABC-type transport system involved in cytochrome bd biosynthesis fused ATPase/permease subunit